MNKFQAQAVLVRKNSEKIKIDSGACFLAETLPNGLLRVRTDWGWLFLNVDGTVHSRQYR